ncbi:universal stress protein, partial [Enterococcus faecium]|uniref:universal stress protein n=1 Tax=Enterococcus faecium TaxID=1352 RepID=UPI0030C8A817
MEEQMYKHILVGVDGSDQDNLAYERAIEVARRNGSRVIVANILENQVYTMMGYSTLNDQLIDQETAAAEELMADCKKYAESVDFHNVETVT